MSNFRLLEFPLIDLPMILATSNAGAIAGLTKAGMNKKSARTFINEELDTANASGWATIVYGEDGAAICSLMVAKKSDRNTVAHEATHVAVMALDWAGIVYTADEHEILAMSVGWIVERHSESWKKQESTQ